MKKIKRRNKSEGLNDEGCAGYDFRVLAHSSFFRHLTFDIRHWTGSSSVSSVVIFSLLSQETTRHGGGQKQSGSFSPIWQNGASPSVGLPPTPWQSTDYAAVRNDHERRSNPRHPTHGLKGSELKKSGKLKSSTPSPPRFALAPTSFAQFSEPATRIVPTRYRRCPSSPSSGNAICGVPSSWPTETKTSYVPAVAAL